MDEQATVAPSPLALAGTDLEVQLGDAHVIERVMLFFRTLIVLRGGGADVNCINKLGMFCHTSHYRARHRVRPP